MPELLTQIGPEQIVFTLFILFLSLMWLNRSYSIPLLGVINRWVRWIFFSLAIGVLIVDQELTDRPIWAVSTVAFLGWFLIETLYFWLYTRAISFSEIPLIPMYRMADRDEWPVDSRLIKLKNWLRTHGFKQSAFLLAELTPEVFIRNAVYENEGQTCRVQIVFMPMRGPQVQPFFIVSSVAKDGRRLITNNIPMPFGGTYPENWNVVRKPLIRSVESLLKVHTKYQKVLDFELAPFEESPLEEINGQQQMLEKTNIKNGFILPREYHEDYGMLSSDARYRLWKEIWMISYLGHASDHYMRGARAE
ncbi:MAG: hypothetical protein ACPGN3_04720 [Opitutales bacterium]